MQPRHWIMLVVLLGLPCMPAGSVPAAVPTSPASQPLASQPAAPVAASQPAVFNRAQVRNLIEQMQAIDPVAAADAAVQLKLLARRGAPVWQGLEEADPSSVRGLLLWLKEHPGDIHRRSALRPRLEMMDLYIKEPTTGQVRLMNNYDRRQYGDLARELLRDGDPIGYWAMLDVARTATEVLGKGPDQVGMTYVLPFLDRHLDMHLVVNSLKSWKGYWTKPLTEKRSFVHPMYGEEPMTPQPFWQIPTRLFLENLDKYQVELEKMGLWQTPVWETRYTAATRTAELLKALATETFPARQHIGRLLRHRMADRAVREEVVQAIRQQHPRRSALQMWLTNTELLPHAKAIRKAWPAWLEEQAPGMLDDLVSENPRRQIEGLFLTMQTVPFVPDRQAANRFALDLFEASGAGTTETSVLLLTLVDNPEGIQKLLSVYYRGHLPPSLYNTLHRWVRSASDKFRTGCADRDLAPLMVKLSTTTQPAIDTSKDNWAQILRSCHDIVWWRLNGGKLVWNDKDKSLEVPAGQLTRPTEQQILETHANYAEELERSAEEAAGISPRHQPAPRSRAAVAPTSQPAPQAGTAP